MLKSFITCSAYAVCMILLSSCNFRPTKTNIKEKIVGEYCAENYRLILTANNTYKNIRMSKVTETGTPYEESCSGKYEIAIKEGHWIIRFNAPTENKSIADCRQEYTLWTEKEGYLIGQEEVVMRDLFDNTALKKGNCK